ncbi:MAG: RNA methyltransferase [Saprospiraceae bacterium]|nr:RNA methyltransferase [Saprospiraceae bacterium]
MQLPVDFKIAMKSQLEGAYEDFEQALSAPSPISIRLNVSKHFNWKENIGGVKWNNKGVYLEERPIFTLDPAFHAGAYYVQEASSMFVAEAVRQIVASTSNRPLRVLDLCAAPGGKSTLLLDELPDNSLLWCNEVIRNRFQILKYNLIKWGKPGIIASQMDSQQLRELGPFFDIILVDAPCSGEGLFRKTPEAMEEWSTANVELCAGRQKRILGEAFGMLKAGGYLLYSTCTYNEKENEENVNWAVDTSKFTPIGLALPKDWGIEEKVQGYQFYPHRLRGEGFYLACLQKVAEEGTTSSKRKTRAPKQQLQALSKKEKEALAPWLASPSELFLFKTPKGQIRACPKAQLEAIQQIYAKWPFLFYGLEIGTFKGKDFVPSPSLALSTFISPEVPTLAVNRKQALSFLRKDPIEGLETLPKGWLLIQYQGLGLGWIKSLGNRINNYYPKEWRIRMSIPEEE